MNILKHDVDVPVNAKPLSALFEKNVSTLHIRPFAAEQMRFIQSP